MTKNKEERIDLAAVRQLIDSVENNLQMLKKLLFDQAYQATAKGLHLSSKENKDSKIIEGVFDGEEMIDKGGKKYQVPQNYASKSKLVAGDILKLTITSDGSFIYKQIGPVERQTLIGEVKEKNSKYQVAAGGKNYNVLLASITYFKAKAGDQVTIAIPKNKESNWAAVEGIIGK